MIATSGVVGKDTPYGLINVVGGDSPRTEFYSRDPWIGFPDGGVSVMSSVPPREYEFSQEQNFLFGALALAEAGFPVLRPNKVQAGISA